MSLPRFFLEEQVLGDQTESAFPLRLSRADAQHAKVLRLRAGEHVAVIDAASDYFECEILSFDADMPIVCISTRGSDVPARPQVVLVQGLAKGDKMDAVIRHATELGVSAFVPFSCERSVVKLDAKRAASRRERWQAIAKSAAMQSGQPSVPEVALPSSLEQVCELVRAATAVLVCWEEASGTASLGQALRSGMQACACADPADARIAVVVGPEGGLSAREVDTLVNQVERGFLVSLGQSILRTETAGVVAPALVLYELGFLGPKER